MTSGLSGENNSNNYAHSDVLFDIMDEIEYRRISSNEDFEAVARLRHKAFDKSDIYVDKSNGRDIEDIDFDPDTKVFGIYYRGELASTIRVKHVTAKSRNCGSMELFPSVLNSMLDQGMSFVDPGRLAIDQELSKLVPSLNLLTVRLPIIGGLYLGVDYGLWSCKQEHAAFYRRFIRATQLAGPISIAGLKTMSVLMGSNTQEKMQLFSRRPIFNYTQTEARLLFDEPNQAGQTLTVAPTARMALRAA